jgi:hypothetical protein
LLVFLRQKESEEEEEQQTQKCRYVVNKRLKLQEEEGERSDAHANCTGFCTQIYDQPNRKNLKQNNDKASISYKIFRPQP